MKTRNIAFVLSGLALALTMSTAFATPVSTIFDDQFNRINNSTVGNSWVEINNDSNDVAIYNNALRLRDEANNARGTVTSPDAAATRTISTAGYQNINVQFNWAALTDSENSDLLGFSWKKTSDSVFTNVASFTLGGNGSFNLASFDLGDLANDTSIDLRFWTRVSEDNEGAMVDWVTVSGTSIPAVTAQMAAVPEPATFALLGIGFLGAGMARRRKA